MNEKRLKRKVNFLTFYALISSLLFMTLILTGFKNSEKKESFDEVTVKRLNIVDETGKNLRMVISNGSRQHPGMINGEKFPARERPSGIIFFNSIGDECGGLIYDGNEKNAGMVLSFDQYKNDQVMQMQYERTQDDKQQYGVNIWDRSENITLDVLIKTMDSMRKQDIPQKEIMAHLIKTNDGKPISAQRLFAGKNYDNQVGLFIKDEFGNERINIYVDGKNKTKLEILDEDGNIIKSF
jgi:hypothetical protein